jgi:regulator of RNase E activity RraB
MFANTITSDETRSFAEEIERDPNPPDSLYSVEFDKVVKIVQRFGKADQLLDSEV